MVVLLVDFLYSLALVRTFLALSLATKALVDASPLRPRLTTLAKLLDPHTPFLTLVFGFLDDLGTFGTDLTVDTILGDFTLEAIVGDLWVMTFLGVVVNL